MGSLALIILAVGIIVSLLSGIWGLVLAFQDSVTWGLLYLLIPYASLVFFITHWSKRSVRQVFFISLVGLGLIVAGVLGVMPSWTGPTGPPSASFESPGSPAVQPLPTQSPPLEESAPIPTPADTPLPIDPSQSYDYRQSMLDGYAAFEQKDYQTALVYFQRALQARPGDRYATQAIENAEAIIQRIP